VSVDRIVAGWDYTDLIERIMDKGIVLDAAGRVQLLGHRLADTDEHVVVGSLDTYLKKVA
jgi:hypothetical protein